MALRIYPDMLRLIRTLRPAVSQIAKRDRDLARQLTRALTSTALNIAEGERMPNGRGRTHFIIAMGSANESRSALEIAEAVEYVGELFAERDELDRIARTLRKLSR